MSRLDAEVEATFPQFPIKTSVDGFFNVRLPGGLRVPRSGAGSKLFRRPRLPSAVQKQAGSFGFQSEDLAAAIRDNIGSDR